jgi:cell division protein ZapA
MAEVTLTINGRNYGIACDDGQEKRVRDLGYYIDQRVREIARAGAATNESHLMVLTSLMLADEIFDMRDNVSSMESQVRQSRGNGRDEVAIAGAIGELSDRIDDIADRIQKA